MRHLSHRWLICLALVGFATPGVSGAAPATDGKDVTRHSMAATPPGAELTPDEENNIAVYRAVSPSVVFVKNKLLRRKRFSLNVMEIPRGSGTGFVWDSSGLIVTNYHVVRGADRVIITVQSGKSYDAKLVGKAPEKDLALLKIDAPGENLKAIPLGDSASLAVGRKVLAIGNPFSLDTTLTVGVVSALGREIESIANETIKNVIQTDAAINPGNSGGPLLDSKGRLVGVNTAIVSPSGISAGIGFAIPVNTVKVIIPQLLQYGRLIRPVLGAEIIPDHLTRRYGVRGAAIYAVVRGSPAHKAGMVGVRQDQWGQLHFGDIIIAINGDPVTNTRSLNDRIQQFKPGDQVEVTTLRNDTVHNYAVTLSRRGD